MLMKSFFQLMVIGMTSAMVLACHETNEMEPKNDSEDVPSEKVNILFLPKASSYEGAVPRMVSNVGDVFFIEQTTPGLSETKTLQMIDHQSGSNYAALMTEQSALICQYPENASEPDNKVLMASQSDEGMRLAICDINWETGEYTIETETFIETGTTRSSYGDMDFAARSVDKLLLDIGSGVDALGDVGGVLNLSVVKNITSTFNLVGISTARQMLWEDDPEMLEEVREKTIKDATVNFVLNLLPSSLQRIWHGCRLASSLGGADWWPQSGPNINEDGLDAGNANDFSHRRVRRLSEIANSTQEEMEEWVEAKPKYIVSMSVSNVGETNATFSGSFRLNDGAETGFWDMGYVLTGPNGKRTIDSWELKTVNLTDLQPGTEYEVYAYVRTVMGTFTSPKQKFCTDGKLEVHPQSITFDYTGGTRGIAVTVGPNMTWDITGMPNWCKMTGRAEGSFYIEAGATKEARQGTIVITATFANGKTKTASVAVEQMAEPVVIPGLALFMFSGNINTKYRIASWKNGSKLSDKTTNEEPISTQASVMIQNGKYYLSTSLGTIAFAQWEVGSTPPLPVEYDSYQEFNQSYSLNEIRITGKCHKQTGGSEESNVSFWLTVSNLNTSTPVLTSEWYEQSSSTTGNTKSLSEIWFTQNLTGTKMTY